MILDELGKRILFFDGAMGTQLQAHGLMPGELPETWNLSHPDIVRSIHLQYLLAGADVVTTNTFGANALKYGDGVEETVAAAVHLARQAVLEAGHGYVALDMGPTGKLLQPYGDLPFEDAVALYRQQALAGEKAGADCLKYWRNPAPRTRFPACFRAPSAYFWAARARTNRCAARCV